MAKNFDTKSSRAAISVGAMRCSKFKIFFELRGGCAYNRHSISVPTNNRHTDAMLFKQYDKIISEGVNF